MSTVGVKLEDTTRNRLRSLGAIRDRSPHWLMRTAIEEYLQREEAFEQEKQEDMQRWERYQVSGLAISHDTVTSRLKELAHGNG